MRMVVCSQKSPGEYKISFIRGDAGFHSELVKAESSNEAEVIGCRIRAVLVEAIEKVKQISADTFSKSSRHTYTSLASATMAAIDAGVHLQGSIHSPVLFDD